MTEMQYNELFAKNLRYFLEKYDMTQADLAKRLNVGTTTVYSWVHAMKTPRMSKVDALCNIFNCTRSDLMTEQPYKNMDTASDNMESAPRRLLHEPRNSEDCPGDFR